MKTVKLYQKDRYLKECSSRIKDIIPGDRGKSPESSLLTLVLDETVFFPTGGGQSADKGTINGLEVTDVYEYEGIIYHVLNPGSYDTETPPQFKKGEIVHCKLDWEHRFLNMQRHCGEHILSGIFFREYGGVNRGFHMGTDFMTIDISLEDQATVDCLDWDMILKAEAFANEVIWSDAPVTVRYFYKKSDADSLPLRKALSLEDDISIVCVGDINNPADCVACCGTHPDTAGQVGIIKVLKFEKYKGMYRIYFEAGASAYKIFEKSYNILHELSNKFSAGIGDIKDKIFIQEKKLQEVKNALYHANQSLLKLHTEEILADITRVQAHGSSSPKSITIMVKEFDTFDIDHLLKLGRNFNTVPRLLLFLVHRASSTLLLFSDGKVDCGKLVKENAHIYQGKGGGNNLSARVIFPNPDNIDVFIDLIDKHLR